MAVTDESQRKSTFREYYEALLIAVIFVNFARIFVFQAFKIPSPSMEDNLKVGDHIIVNKFIFGAGTNLDRLLPLRLIRRGDIIVFRYPLQPDTDFVKRVIGLPGDVLEIHNKKVFINGRELHEPYVVHEDRQIYPPQDALPEPYRSRDQFKAFTVPAEHYFAMGDNRDRSSDSRYWGTVPRSMITGRPFMVYWSYRGTPSPPDSSPKERAKELLGVVAHFFTKTRWYRTFFIVDSRYHYHPETNAATDTSFAP
jgi:signal peptidase I